MEITEYISMARRWAWFLIVASELDKLGGILGSIFQIPNYQTVNRKLALHSSQAEKDTDTYLKNQRMMQTFIQLLKPRSRMEGASALIGFNGWRPANHFGPFWRWKKFDLSDQFHGVIRSKTQSIEKQYQKKENGIHCIACEVQRMSSPRLTSAHCTVLRSNVMIVSRSDTCLESGTSVRRA